MGNWNCGTKNELIPESPLGAQSYHSNITLHWSSSNSIRFQKFPNMEHAFDRHSSICKLETCAAPLALKSFLGVYRCLRNHIHFEIVIMGWKTEFASDEAYRRAIFVEIAGARSPGYSFRKQSIPHISFLKPRGCRNRQWEGDSWEGAGRSWLLFFCLFSCFYDSCPF